jgi:adenine phosphoribosyltransferase
MDALKDVIRTIPDFPTAGIQFKDITPLLRHPALLRAVVERLVEPFRGDGISAVVGMEARGFNFGSLAARELEVGFIPLRKPGKLPHDVHSVDFQLEYGSTSLQIHKDALANGERALLVDDLIATGGTAAASCQLVERTGAAVAGCAFVIELEFLGGRTRLAGRRVHTLIRY